MATRNFLTAYVAHAVNIQSALWIPGFSLPTEPTAAGGQCFLSTLGSGCVPCLVPFLEGSLQGSWNQALKYRGPLKFLFGGVKSYPGIFSWPEAVSPTPAIVQGPPFGEREKKRLLKKKQFHNRNTSRKITSEDAALTSEGGGWAQAECSKGR